MAAPDASQRLVQPAQPGPDPITVEVIHCANRSEADREQVVLPAGSTIADALRSSGVLLRHPGLEPIGERAGVGIHGRLVALATVLRDGDRVELYRPLEVEPMEARRARQRAQKTARPPRRDSPAAA